MVLGGEAVSNERGTPVQEAKGKREEKSGVIYVHDEFMFPERVCVEVTGG